MKKINIIIKTCFSQIKWFLLYIILFYLKSFKDDEDRKKIDSRTQKKGREFSRRGLGDRTDSELKESASQRSV